MGGELEQRKILFSISEVKVTVQLKLSSAECLSGCSHHIGEMAGGLVPRKIQDHLASNAFIQLGESCLIEALILGPA